MFKVERCNDERGQWSVSYYVKNDPNPTPTVQYFRLATQANGNALERAAKLALLSGALRGATKPGSESVMFSTGKTSVITVSDESGTTFEDAFCASEPDPDDCD